MELMFLNNSVGVELFSYVKFVVRPGTSNPDSVWDKNDIYYQGE